ncbi:urea transporter [Pseudoalteromonas sp. JC28]|uniref:sodium:solute symporter family protein n=1 Tax=unclassified Pseudoalteromonas TaxID=194690 RepID=UPI00157464EB|nr:MULTISPECIES: sodium:solute symporter family protein [unclassified Pseudoalteromonas]MCF2828348.1 sodium:solute symporter family protein [Pseudoalteromonas sp. OF5H-5]MCF2830545.1 sodium:solute symporter family protein [Pseudoalteromonas sp. DL2-H6]MCF2924436.1 sodium:solute symporter family protein [Pseudoalteromonas sp. DL2-H1]NSY34872.1 urea transporter [Pseudoalteromonas sp. JC28]QUI65138.1 urea transporter [Pseudoalteromonas sp. A22]
MINASLALGLALAFALLWVFFGWWIGRRVQSHNEFALAGRNVGLAFACATAMATWVTSNTTLVAPQLTYQFGIWGMIGYACAAFGLLLFAPLSQRIKTLLPHGYTSGDFMRLRFGRFSWWVFLLISFVYAMSWLVSLGMAGGILLHTLSGLDYHLGMSIILLMCVVYTLFGGLKAVIATDFLQAIIILAGVVGIAIVVAMNVGLEPIHQKLSSDHPKLLDLLFPAAVMFLFNNIFFGLGEIFHSNVWWSRAFAFKGGVGKKAYFIAGLLWLPIPIVTGFIALAAPSLGLYPASADMVGPLVASQVLGYTGSIILFIVVFSALASSLDSLLAATSDLINQDIYLQYIKPKASDSERLKSAKWIIVILGVVTWLLCLPKIATLGALLNFAGAFVASTIWPIVFGLYFARMTGNSAGWAMLLGTLSGLIGYFYIGFYVAALVSCAVSLLICVIAWRFSQQSFHWQALGTQSKVEDV